MKTYKDDGPFPDLCWFADWQPYKGINPKIINGHIIIRKRDQASTVVLFEIPVGGRRGVKRPVAMMLAEELVETLNEYDAAETT